MAAAVITPSGAPPEPMTACTPVPMTAAAMSGRKIAVPNEPNARAGGPDIGDQLLMARTVEYDDDEVFDVAVQTFGDVLQVLGDRRVEFHGVLAGGADHDFFHVAVGSVQQSAAFGSRQHGDGAGAPVAQRLVPSRGSTAMSTSGTSRPIGKFRAHLLADVQHGSFVALAFANHDGAAHGNAVHSRRMASVATWSDSLRSPWPMVRAERWPQFRLPEKSRSEIALDVLAEASDFAFRFGMSRHKCLQKKPDRDYSAKQGGREESERTRRPVVTSGPVREHS